MEKMVRYRWNRRRLLSIIVAAIVFYLIVSARYNTYQLDTVIKNARPEDVWEFIADFSKMKSLNPTILDFKILSDLGNAQHWKYEVEYTEKLQFWPYLLNKSKGFFSVRQLEPAEGGDYVVESTHKTCFFVGLYCLKTKDELRISQINKKDTYVLENIWYQCPPFLGSMCQRELEHQRRTVLLNLSRHFAKNYQN